MYFLQDPQSNPLLDLDYLRSTVFPVLNVVCASISIIAGLAHRRVFGRWKYGALAAVIPNLVFVFAYSMLLMGKFDLNTLSLWVRPVLFLYPLAASASSIAILWPKVKTLWQSLSNKYKHS